MLQDPNVERYVENAIKPLKKEIAKLKVQIEELNKALRIHDVSGSLGFDKGYEQGYNDATREACQEIAKNYHPNDR